MKIKIKLLLCAVSLLIFAILLAAELPGLDKFLTTRCSEREAEEWKRTAEASLPKGTQIDDAGRWMESNGFDVWGKVANSGQYVLFSGKEYDSIGEKSFTSLVAFKRATCEGWFSESGWIQLELRFGRAKQFEGARAFLAPLSPIETLERRVQ